MRFLLTAALAVAVALAGCGDDDGGLSDAGSGTDAGLPRDDAGPAMDTGVPPPPEDAGSVADAGTVPPCPEDPWPSDVETFEDDVLVELNARRAMTVSCGAAILGPSGALAMDASLRRATRCHAAYMAAVDMTTARGPDGSFYTDRAHAAGYGGMAMGTGYGFVVPDTTAATLVDGLIGNETVCTALLAPAATDVGVGVASMAGGLAGDRRYYEIVVGN